MPLWTSWFLLYIDFLQLFFCVKDEDGGEESAFQRHFETGPAAETIEALESAGRPWRQVETRWPNLGRLVVRLPAVEDFPSTTAATAGGQRKLLDDDDAASKSTRHIYASLTN